MTRSDWNVMFALEIKALTDLPSHVCLDAAHEATDYFRDGYSPEAAAEEEVSYMEWE